MTRGRASVLAAVFAVGVACSTTEATDACANGARDGTELGVDCGGSCAKCPGEACVETTECSSGACDQGLCTAKPGKLCGVGTTSKCIAGQTCELDADCTSNACVNATCAPGSGGPMDGVKNGDETDVDCGGTSAPKCVNGKTCLVDGDCAESYCPVATKVCAAPRNDDGVKNGTETDVDCGGQSGKKCNEGLTCAVDADCKGACAYTFKCVDAPSCKPRYGGDTCGVGNFEDAVRQHESCCRSLLVPGYTAPGKPGMQVYLDKYEVTAGRVRAFVEDIMAKNGGVPNLRGWLMANTPAYWPASFNFILPTSGDGPVETMPHSNLGGTYVVPASNNVGLNYLFGAARYVYVHGEDCYHNTGTYGFSTYWYPPAVMTGQNGGLARFPPLADFPPNPALAIGAKEQLDAKSMTCIPAAVLAAFCHWDGGQLATDEVLDFVTNNGVDTGNAATCGSRCAPLASVQYASDAGSDGTILYRYPFYASTSEGTFRIAPPGRVTGDVVRITPGTEPWMDVRGNVNEIALNMTGATFTGNFSLKYQGIGYSSARALANPTALQYAEYKAAYSGGRCMRFKTP